MLSWEKKLTGWIEKNIKIIAMLLAVVIGAAIRVSLLKVISPDYVDFLEQWFDEIKALGGLKGLATSVGNYNFLYQTLIAILTYIPLPCLYSYKLLSIVFDVTLAFSVWTYVKKIFCNGENSWGAVAAFSLVWLFPTVFIDSAAWSQCDAMYTTFLVLTLYYLQKDTKLNYIKAFALYGLALSFKLQAVFLLPFLLFYWFKKKDFTIFNFLVSPLVMLITGIPCLVAGRPIGQLFSLYKGQVTEYSGKLSYFYPGVWLIFYEPTSYDIYINYRNGAIALAMAAILGLVVYLIVKETKFSAKNILYIAFMLVFTTVLFLPAMHERYGFFYVILAMIIAVVNRKTIPGLVAFCVIDLITYSGYINNYWKEFSVFEVIFLAFVNIGVYCFYFYRLNKDMD